MYSNFFGKEKTLKTDKIIQEVEFLAFTKTQQTCQK